MEVVISGVTLNCQTYGCLPINVPYRSLRRDCITGGLIVTEFYTKLEVSISDTTSKEICDALLNVLISNVTLNYSDDNYSGLVTLVPGSLSLDAYEDTLCRFKFQLVGI